MIEIFDNRHTTSDNIAAFEITFPENWSNQIKQVVQAACFAADGLYLCPIERKGAAMSKKEMKLDEEYFSTARTIREELPELGKKKLSF